MPLASARPALTAVLLQTLPSVEVRVVSTAAMLSDNVRTLRSAIDKLADHRDLLASGLCLPVGSVEFLREAMALAGIQEPVVDPYPAALHPWLHRQVRKGSISDVIGRCFVKPAARLKAFDGFLLDPASAPAPGDEHAREQRAALAALSPTESLWICEPVEFLSEHRYYVQEGAILGRGRYDADGEEDAAQPDLQEVMAAVEAWPRPEPYALDMGVLADGRSALVEVNEAWSIGLYEQALAPKAYLAYLAAGWEGLMQRQRTLS